MGLTIRSSRSPGCRRRPPATPSTIKTSSNSSTHCRRPFFGPTPMPFITIGSTRRSSEPKVLSEISLIRHRPALFVHPRLSYLAHAQICRLRHVRQRFPFPQTTERRSQGWMMKQHKQAVRTFRFPSPMTMEANLPDPMPNNIRRHPSSHSTRRIRRPNNHNHNNEPRAQYEGPKRSNKSRSSSHSQQSQPRRHTWYTPNTHPSRAPNPHQPFYSANVPPPGHPGTSAGVQNTLSSLRRLWM